MKRKFIESTVFNRRIEALGDKSLLRNIQNEILKNPLVGVVVPGTSGIRKVRVAKDGRGKSGSFRVFYLDLPEYSVTHLMFLLIKNERANINQKEKKILRQTVEKIKKEIS